MRALKGAMEQIVDDGPEYTDTLKKLRAKYDFPELKSDTVAKYYLKYNTDNWMLDGREQAAEGRQGEVEGDVRRRGEGQGREGRRRRAAERRRGDHLGLGETSTVTQLEEQAAAQQVTRKDVKLVDVDIHPVMLQPDMVRRLPERWGRHLERYGRRAPFVTDLYPRPRNKGMRADSWPEGGIPGSSYELLREQLLDEHDVDFGILLCLNAHDAGYEHPEYDAAINRVVNEWIVEEWLDRDERLRSCISVPYDHPELAIAEIERWAGDDRFVQVLLPAAGQEPFGVAQVLAGVPGGRRRRPAGRVPHRRLHGHRGAGWPSFYLEEHAGYGVVMQSCSTSLVCEGTFAAIPEPQGRHDRGRRAGAAALRWRLDERVAAAARRGPRAGPPAVGVHPRPRVVRHPADGGARRSEALPADRSSRPTSRTGSCSRPTIRTGTSTPRRSRSRAGSSKEGRREAPRGHGHRALRPADARRSRMTVATATDAVDCDLHVAPTGVDTLLPYLDEYWRSYIDDATIRMGQAAYPTGAGTTGGAPAGTHEELAAVLDRDGPAARDPELPRARRRASQPALRRGDGDRDQHVDARRVPRARRPRCARAWRSPRSTSRPRSRRSSAGTGTVASRRSSCRCATTSRTATATTTRSTPRRTSAGCRSRSTRGAAAATRPRRPA